MKVFCNPLMELPLRTQIGFGRTFGVLQVVWTLGDVVRKLRDRERWTQAELGQRAGGLDKSVIVRLEKDSDKSERATIARVAKALSVSPADLYALADELSLAAELTEMERRSVMAFQRRLIAKRQQAEARQPVASPPPDRQAQVSEFREPIQKRRLK